MRRVGAIAALASCVMAAELPHFRPHLITRELNGGYQVLAVDLNKDRQLDLVVVAQKMSELFWFEGPGWTKHVMASGLKDLINAAAWDIDGDGIPEVALAHDFDMSPMLSLGTVSLLKANADPRQPWSIRTVDSIPTSHRLRWADIDGSGKKILIDAPLVGVNSREPDYTDHVPILYWWPDEWKRHMIDNLEQGVLHGITIVERGRHERDEIYTASFAGIRVRSLSADGRWQASMISKGLPGDWPKCGASDIALGRTKQGRFLASIEPWHGNVVAVYNETKQGWQRSVLTSDIQDGHTIQTADLNGDGADEIVVGSRGTHNVLLFRNDGVEWQGFVLDDTIPAASCAVADLNGDGRLDIVCIGGTTLKWYENLGSPK
ncbi:MAG TPA: VCBS repeat-containing protein [Bryobacteraceae bacterium]|nr:VCBS repeat-containing protein [Bryobacteraceae bacterium]